MGQQREGGGIGQFSYRKGIGHSVKSERMGDFSEYTETNNSARAGEPV